MSDPSEHSESGAPIYGHQPRERSFEADGDWAAFRLYNVSGSRLLGRVSWPARRCHDGSWKARFGEARR